MALESSPRGLQVWLRPRPDRRSRRGATKSQSPRSPNRDSFGTPLWEYREKKSHSDATPLGERRVYYREYGGGISRAWAVVCHVSPS
jgi:hypothetical protein